MLTTRLTFEDFQDIVLNDDDHHWELVDGHLREKPGMSAEHNDAMTYLGVQLANQLDRRQHRVRINAGHVKRPEATYFIPDVSVLPNAFVEPLRRRPGTLKIYPQPLPHVVEIWSSSNADYDIDTKIPVYQDRGDLEIWRFQPYDRTLISFCRQPDGTYTTTTFVGGRVTLHALPHVTIDLDALFD